MIPAASAVEAIFHAHARVLDRPNINDGLIVRGLLRLNGGRILVALTYIASPAARRAARRSGRANVRKVGESRAAANNLAKSPNKFV
jgi:hypothetical protein